MGLLRSKSTIEPNPIHLSSEVVQQLIPELDRHVASLFILFHQYQKHHWLVEGPQFMDIHKFLGEHYEQVHEQVDQVAERMTALGGIPTSNPVEQAKIAYLEHEGEGTYPIRDMLTLDRQHEGTIAVQLRKTIKLAMDLGDYGTETVLKSILVDVEDRAHHLDHFLGEDSLEDGRK
ncbi:DNA starvation/stationary phase protection protein DpsA [Tuwongella immobilis]|uniref:Ferritin/DPS domain-containing protein n=1 Tax=Tuwongella immobilis TaxID=692036 RepID=A0A6C2YP30_9BACT|nr:DNA starvation/stationary phase protection protein DpsA [Tuwongella immobilis]VIP03196.1 ferritin dps family protein : Starvation induced DNA binding protein OS=Salinibacter ruber (strain DSM 13855 / M31) GN=SRU_1117 PE=3 SV=1: Ferritin [Tuwongella immobilis]VTS03675.1 ferritin dps family protein : Starvation induced DNA binding protein OS=Salinibacter ruber (strain DSM 13855 / M31) GN=SRU_1117 PE=3 SV=1: Ferritin [Tuwongella immobilis]